MMFVVNERDSDKDEDQPNTWTVHRLKRPNGVAYKHASADRIKNRIELPDWDSVLSYACINLLGACKTCWPNLEWRNVSKTLRRQMKQGKS